MAKNSLVFAAASSQYCTGGDVLSVFNEGLGGVAGNWAVALSVWVKSTQAGICGIAGRPYFGSVGGRYQLYGNDSASGQLDGNAQDDGGNHDAHATATGWNDGSWHHLLYTADNAGGVLYVDGASVATHGAASTMSGESTAKFLLGAFDSGSGLVNYYTGKLAQPAVKFAKLTAQNAADLAGGTATPSSLGFRSWWDLTEGTGTTAADAGPGGHPLTLTNGVTWDADIPGQISGGGGGVGAAVPRLRSARNRALLRM